MSLIKSWDREEILIEGPAKFRTAQEDLVKLVEKTEPNPKNLVLLVENQIYRPSVHNPFRDHCIPINPFNFYKFTLLGEFTLKDEFSFRGYYVHEKRIFGRTEYERYEGILEVDDKKYVLKKNCFGKAYDIVKARERDIEWVNSNFLLYKGEAEERAADLERQKQPMPKI